MTHIQERWPRAILSLAAEDTPDMTLYNNISIKVCLPQPTSVTIFQPVQVADSLQGDGLLWTVAGSVLIHSDTFSRDTGCKHKLLCILCIILVFSFHFLSVCVLMFSHKSNKVCIEFLFFFRVCLSGITLFPKSTPGHLCLWSACRSCTSPRICWPLSPRTCLPLWLRWGSTRTASRRWQLEPSQDWATWTA